MIGRDYREIEELNRRCCMNLWNMVKCSEQPHGLSPRLIIPNYRGGTHRISEQEARFAFVEALTTTSFYYSVETPTTGTYCFTGSDGNSRSAQTDLSLYGFDGDGLQPLANVEFKYGTSVAPAIEKDIIKLIQEQEVNEIVGNWFHVLKNADHKTFDTLFNERFIPALKTHSPEYNAEILFCFCIVEKLTSYFKWYDSTDCPDVNSFFKLKDGYPDDSWTKVRFD